MCPMGETAEQVATPSRRRPSERVAAVLVVVVAVIGVGAVLRAWHQHSALPPPPTIGSVQVPGVTSRLELATTNVDQGAALRGTVVVENSTGHALEITYCISPFAVSLQNRHAYQQSLLPACATIGVIPVGRSKHPVVSATTYSECTNTGSDVDRGSPSCVGGKPPPLPPGDYLASVTVPEGVSSPEPVHVHIR